MVLISVFRRVDEFLARDFAEIKSLSRSGLIEQAKIATAAAISDFTIADHLRVIVEQNGRYRETGTAANALIRFSIRVGREFRHRWVE